MSDSLQPHGLQHARPLVHHQLPELTQTHELEGWKISVRSGPQGSPAVGLCQGHTLSGLQNYKFAAENRGEVALAASQAFFAFLWRLLLWEDINFWRIRKSAFGTLQHTCQQFGKSHVVCTRTSLTLPLLGNFGGNLANLWFQLGEFSLWRGTPFVRHTLDKVTGLVGMGNHVWGIHAIWLWLMSISLPSSWGIFTIWLFDFWVSLCHLFWVWLPAGEVSLLFGCFGLSLPIGLSAQASGTNCLS